MHLKKLVTSAWVVAGISPVLGYTLGTRDDEKVGGEDRVEEPSPPASAAPPAVVTPPAVAPPALAFPGAGPPGGGPGGWNPIWGPGPPPGWTGGPPPFISALISSWAAAGFYTLQPSATGASPVTSGGQQQPTPGVLSPTTGSNGATIAPTMTSPSGAGSGGMMGGATGSDDGPIGSNRTLVITLSTVLSVVGLLLILGGILICLRYRRRRFPFFSLQRGVSPIDDDEIATWRISRDEKHQAGGAAADNADGRFTSLPTAAGAPASTTTWTSPTLRKPPSLIIYNSPPQSASRFSSDDMGTPRTGNYYNAYQTFGGFTSPVNSNNGRPSLDLLPPTPVIVARAPNSRAGLTDESIPGDEPYIAVNRPVSRRLSKAPPGSSPRAHHHLRTRSSRSSTSVRSYGVDPAWYTDVELSPRPSTEFAGAGGNYGLQYNSSGSSGHQRTVSISSNGNTSYHHRTSSSSGAYSHHHNHSRVYSSSSVPPRLSLGDDFVGGGLSPRPLLRDEIGRAIG